MDQKPFFEFDLTKISEVSVGELKKFSKDLFDISKIVNTASDLKHAKAITEYFVSQLEGCDEDFARFIGSKIQDGRMTSQKTEAFQPLVSKSLQQLINDMINERLKSAIKPEVKVVEEKPKIITTDEELEGYHIIRAIVRQGYDADRLIPKDTQSYFAIFMDNQGKKVCRLYFNGNVKYVAFFDGEREEKIKIDSLNDIYDYSERILNTIKDY